MYNYKARCIKVIDGDTFDLEIDLGFNIKITERVRLARVDTPEIRGEERPEGLKAKQFVNDALYIKTPWLTAHSKDLYIDTTKGKGKYGRWIAEVMYEEDGNMYNLSDVLLKEGLAKEVNYG